MIAGAVRESDNTSRILDAARLLEKEFQADIRILPARRIDLSSTEIRERLRNGHSVRYMLPESVIEYIAENNLYKN